MDVFEERAEAFSVFLFKADLRDQPAGKFRDVIDCAQPGYQFGAGASAAASVRSARVSTTADRAASPT